MGESLPMPYSKRTKANAWLEVLWKRPQEALDRAVTVLAVQSDRLLQRPPAYAVADPNDCMDALCQTFGADAMAYMDEVKALEVAVQEDINRHRTASPIAGHHNGDFALARLCYLACRMQKPKRVLETGVAAGVTSRFILTALEKNGAGTLNSIDLPPLGPEVENHVGYLVPDTLKTRWTLNRGTSKRLMPGLLHTSRPIDLFVHDSLHTYRNIARELNLVTPFLSKPAVVLVDDIDENAAFHEWVKRAQPTFSATIQEEQKRRLFGFALFAHAHSSDT